MTAALIVSISAFVLSVVSLAWQAWSWARSGPVVKVSLTSMLNSWDEPLLAITAVNVGRGPTSLSGWSLLLPDGREMDVEDMQFGGANEGDRLEGHSETAWYIEEPALRRDCERLGVRVEQLRGRVTLGSGKQVSARYRATRR